MNRRLHIGGTVRVEGWEVLNAIAGPHVDHVGNAEDLSRFADGSFEVLYASHVVEHLDYRDKLLATLREWYRVLAPEGRVYVSVPDLDVLARLFVDRQRLSTDERFWVMRMMFGGHDNEYDYHVAGLNEEFLTRFLVDAGFGGVRRVKDFGLFKDTSALEFAGERISLNLIAQKPHRRA
jgi:predicted SAM-dependent methyltransferase